ncbi:cytochrome c [Jiella sp. MQZ9-1]|uniref:Cytochrome c n=1 Tax=Jiella flava TaxID=2816857 RepID=A0A939JVT8_9HYPH|nr:cytochrome c [Jiella flava]MBO0662332.1 cytochrome c [Jiella flava]MCD2470839.1 cytochrome c [Jiella flava]
MSAARPFTFAPLVVAIAAIFAVPAIAANLDAIKERQHLMKENGKATKAGAAMLKGQAEFSPDKAKEVFTQMHEVAMKFGDYFPEDSKTGNKTEAAPAIWNKPDAFKAELMKYQKDTQAALDANPQDLKAFGQSFAMVTKNCKGCHQEFRVDKR